MARSYDCQRIKSNWPYTLDDLAALYDVHPNTVRRWINKDGLSVAIVDQSRPMLLSGAKAREWMKARNDDRRQPCGPNEIYCVACKSPRTVAPETILIISSKPPKITLLGDCSLCRRTLRRFDTEANRRSLTARFGLDAPIMQGARPAPNSAPPSPLKCSHLAGDKND